MKTLTVSFTPNPAITDPADVVAKYRFQASVAGTVLAPLAEFGVGAVSEIAVDPGKTGVDVDFDYAFADAAGNWSPDQKTTVHVEPDHVPDTTPPPAEAGSLAVTVTPAVTPPAAPEAPAPAVPEVPAPAAPEVPAPAAPADPAADAATK